MLKKAKIYLLLAIIVASTAAGALGLPQTVVAQESEPDPNTATWAVKTEDGEPVIDYWFITYKNDSYQYDPGDTTPGAGGFYEDYQFGTPAFEEGTQVFILQEGYRDLSSTHPVLVIYFDPGVDPKSPETKEAKYAAFDSANSNMQPLPSIPFNSSEEAATPPEEATFTPRGGEEAADTPSTCQIKGIGWLICPTVNFLAEITDYSYAILDNTLLKLEPMALPGSNNEAGIELYDSWKMMRDIANVVFIVAFLVIVFSQVTSIGIGNYGIKRLLPKIIIAAILVNISYYICVVAVDISNILGNSLRGFFESGITQPSGGGPFSFTIRADSDGDDIPISSWQDLANIIIGGAGVALSVATAGVLLYAFLPVFLPMILGAALAVLTVVIALTLRQALIVILVVISPLAFVALLLPNTENYFNRWRSLFMAMLLVYPIISIVFGASALASRILTATDDFPVQIVGAGVSVIPLFLTPIVMKVSGGLLNRWVGLVNDPTKGPVDGIRKGLEGRAERWENRRKIAATGDSIGASEGRFGKKSRLGSIFGYRYRSSAKNEAIDSGLKSEAARGAQQHVAQEIQNNRGFANQMAGGSVFSEADPAAIERAMAGAKFTVQKAEIEEVKAAGSIVEDMNFSQLTSYLERASSSAQKAAALDRMVTIGDPGDYEKYINDYASRSGEDESIIRSTLADSLAKNNPLLRAADLDNIRNGQLGQQRYNTAGGTTDENGNPLGKNAATLSEMVKNNVGSNVVSQSKMATMSAGDLKYAFDSTENDPEARAKLADTAYDLLHNDQLKGNIQHNEKQIHSIASNSTKTTATTTASGQSNQQQGGNQTQQQQTVPTQGATASASNVLSNQTPAGPPAGSTPQSQPSNSGRRQTSLGGSHQSPGPYVADTSSEAAKAAGKAARDAVEGVVDIIRDERGEVSSIVRETIDRGFLEHTEATKESARPSSFQAPNNPTRTNTPPRRGHSGNQTPPDANS